MALRSKAAWILLAAAAMLAGWWTLVPRLGQATDAEVRARFAPELLQPIAHPADGRERYEEMLGLLAAFQKPRFADRRPLDAGDPAVRRILAVLEQGPLDRSGAGPNEQFQLPDFGADLLGGVPALAAEGRWQAVEAQMAAGCLLLDRLFESDASQWDRLYSMRLEEQLLRAALALAARGDLPADLAGRLSRQLVVERNSAASLMQVFRAEIQSRGFQWLAARPQQVYAGTYDPLDTAGLLSAGLLEVAGSAGRPPPRAQDPWASANPGAFLPGVYLMELSGHLQPLAGPVPGALVWPARARGTWRDDLHWVVNRIRMNTSRNSYGRLVADQMTHSAMIRRIPTERSLRDQVAAALAVVIFRSRFHRDPRGFDELLVAGLLEAAPRNHERDQPLPFDLQSLFRWTRHEEQP